MPTTPASKLLVFLAAATVIGVNAFTINCGLAPPPTATDVGIDKPDARVFPGPPPPQPTVAGKAQLTAVLQLVEKNTVVFSSSSGSWCTAFPGGGGPLTSVAAGTSAAGGWIATEPCTVRAKSPIDGTIGPVTKGSCTVFESDSATLTAVHTFEVTLTDAKTSIETDTDFTALPAGDHDGFVVTDRNDVRETVALHDGQTYCDTDFKLE